MHIIDGVLLSVRPVFVRDIVCWLLEALVEVRRNVNLGEDK